MTPGQAKKLALAAVNRMGPLMRPGYRAHELDMQTIYAPYIPLYRTPDIMLSLQESNPNFQAGVRYAFKKLRKSLYKRETFRV